MIRIRSRRVPADETPAQRQAREDREASRAYGMNRRSSKYYSDLDAIGDRGAKPETPNTNKTK
jgi:hypothetical protein